MTNTSPAPADFARIRYGVRSYLMDKRRGTAEAGTASVHRGRAMRCIIGLFVVGAVAITAAPVANADSPNGAVVIELDDFDQVDINPCTGQEALVSFSDMKAVVRVAVDPSGTLHQVFVISGSWTADDYSGRFHQSVVVNDFDPGSAGDFVKSEIVVARGFGPEGRPMTFYRAHVRMIDGVPTVAIVESDARCVA